MSFEEATSKYGPWKSRSWDLVMVHDCVSILLCCPRRHTLLFVRQFRPAVYAHHILPFQKQTENDVNNAQSSVSTSSTSHSAHRNRFPWPLPKIVPDSELPEQKLEIGYTLELCAGIIDDPKKSPEETAKSEILEECGYAIKTSDLEKILVLRSGVGITSAKQWIFYCEVDDDMKVGSGGGNSEEQESIQTVEYGWDEANELIFDEKVPRPAGFCAALLWFYSHKKSTLEKTRDNVPKC